MTNQQILAALEGGLIVSCQPVDGGPMDSPAIVASLALAARDGGASGVRIEGVENVRATAARTTQPIVGIVKRDLPDSPVRITPFIEDVEALIAAGAAIVAVDATDRARPVPVADLLAAIHRHGRLAMADLSSLEEARSAVALGFDIVGTTLSGYTGGPVPEAPDFDLVTATANLGRPVIAEGRYNTPERAAAAIRHGAMAVCVGTAITRTEVVTGWFRDAVRAAHGREATLAYDIGGTKTLAALVAEGRVLDERRVATSGAIGSTAWFDDLAEMASDWRGRFPRVGIAATGIIDAEGCWGAFNPAILAVPPGTRLSFELGRRLGVPAGAWNDAQAAAWGEFRQGAGVGRDMVFLTVSSGIGGGLVLQGRLFRGARGLAGSLGQVGLAAGSRLEQRASGFGIAESARALGHEASAQQVFAAAEAGAAWAQGLVDAAAGVLATALADVQTLIDPEIVVVGGSVGLNPLYQRALANACAPIPDRVRPRLVPARLGAHAGVLGAAALATAL